MKTTATTNLFRFVFKALIFQFFIFTFHTGFSQEITVTGTVSDAGNLKKIPGVLVKERYSQVRVYTDSFGNYSMMLEPGYVHISVSMGSYRTKKHVFLLERDTVLNFSLKPYTVDEVQILGRETYSAPELNKLSIKLPYYDRVPSLLGESDPLRTLTLFPGVQPALEIGSGLVVRGGYPGQNLILLDGMNLYNPYHVLGIISTFNSYAIQSIDLYKGMFPARYGNRIASVLDLNTDLEKKKKRDRRISIGLLSSKFAFSDSLPKLNGDYMLAGRTAYLSMVTLPVLFAYRAGNVDDFFGYYLYDLNGKLNLELPKGGRLKIAGFTGQDYLKGSSGDFGIKESIDNRNWGNTGLNATYTKTLKEKWDFQSGLSFTRYRYKRGIRNYEVLEDSTLGDSTLEFTLDSEFQLIDFELNSSIGRDFNENIRLTTGISANRVGFLREAETGENRFEQRFLLSQWWEADLKWKNLTFQPGIRLIYLSNPNVDFTFAEPRVNLNWKVGKNTLISASVGRVSQAFHLISQTNLGLPNDIWIPATEDLPAQTGFQYAVGISWGNDETPWKIQLEGYYRKVNDMVFYKPGGELSELLPDETNPDLFLTGGVGESMGLEAFIRYQTPRWQGWVSYTLAKSTQQYDNFLGGKELPTPYDQRHNLQLVSNWDLNEKWLFSALWVFQSGRPLFLPISRMVTPEGRNIFIYPEKAGRFPFYHRLDIGFSKRKKVKNSRTRTWKFGVYNAYNQANPLFLDINSPGASISQGVRTPQPGKVTSFTLLPFTPYFSHEWRF